MSVYFEVSFKLNFKIMIYDIESKSPKPNKTYAYVQFWFENNKRRLKTVIGWHVTAQNEYLNRLKNTIG